VSDAATTIVWLAPEPPAPDRRRALEAWARARGLALAPPSDERPSAIAVDPGVAQRGEDALDGAHDALAAHDGAAVDRELAVAESLLRAHAELPQAAWLMAEVERARASRFRSVDPVDVEAADLSWTRALALDGGRLPSLNEAASGQRPRPATVAVELPPGETFRIDGNGAPGAAPTLEGLHALVVISNGEPVWRGWVELPAGDSTLRPAAPEPAPCSFSDTRRAVLAPAGVAAGGVRCPRWVVATAGTRPDAIRVAACEAGRCEAMADWETPGPWSRTPPAAVRRAAAHSAWPAWATWALVGAGVAVAAGVGAATAASGAFSPASSESRFVSRGVARGP
jgi:hypothetical protein